MAKSVKKRRNNMIKLIATILIALCLVFIGMLLQAADEQAFLVVFVVAFIIAIIIIFFTAKDMLK